MTKTSIAVGLLACWTAYAQTQVDLRTQTKSVDFSQASSTRPMKVGSALPATCSTGEMFLQPTAPVGKNLFACVATNMWAQQAAASTQPTIQLSAELKDFAAERSTTPGTLAIGAACSAAAPCRTRIGQKTYTVSGPARAILTAGTGTAYVYIAETGALTVGYDGTLEISCDGCLAAGGITGFPSNSIPLHVWTATQTPGEWDASGTDVRAMLSVAPPLAAGTGILLTEDAGTGAKSFELDTSVAMTKAAVQTGEVVYCADQGSTDDYVCSMNPALPAYTAGTIIELRAAIANAGAATLNIDGLGARPILSSDGTPLSDGEIVAGGHYIVLYDGSAFRLTTTRGGAPLTAGTGILMQDAAPGGRSIALDTSVVMTKAAAQSGDALYCADEGSTDDYVCSLRPALQAYAAGSMIQIHTNTANSGAATLNIDGLGAKAILNSDGSALSDGQIGAGRHYIVLYDGSAFRMTTAPSAMPLAAGTGIVMEDAAPGGKSIALDTSVAMTKAAAQSGDALYCADEASTDDYVCSLRPALQAYAAGSMIQIHTNTANSGAATLNIDGLGAKPIVNSDGSGLVDGELIAGGHYVVLYDGDTFRLTATPAPVLAAGTGIVLQDASAGVKTISLNTSIAMTKADMQSGGAVYCPDQGSTDDYACSLQPSLQAYAGGGAFQLHTNTANTGAATLNIDGLGARPIVNSDGTELRDGELVAGGHYIVLYDGSAFRLTTTPAPAPVISASAPDHGAYVTTAADAALPNARVIDARDGIEATMDNSKLSLDTTPFDESVMALSDDFTGGNSGGGLHWIGATISGSVGSATYIPGETNHPGIYRVATNANSAGNFAISLRQNASAPMPPLSTSAGWEAQWIVRMNDTAQATWVGFSDIGYSSPNRIEIKYENGIDSNFMFRLCAASSCVTANSTVAPVAGAWLRLRIRSTSTGQVLYSVNNEPEVMLSGATFPGMAMTPFVFVSSQGIAASKNVDVDWFAFKMRGLNR